MEYFEFWSHGVDSICKIVDFVRLSFDGINIFVNKLSRQLPKRVFKIDKFLVIVSNLFW